MRLRPLSPKDRENWRRTRRANAAWLVRWDATAPSRSHAQPRSFSSMVRQMRTEARAGRQLPFAVEYDGRFVGQVTVSNIVRGSAQFASIGYWIDQAFAGRGIIPRAVAMAIDHCFGPVGLHRIEIAIRPENVSSLRVVEKLGINEVGFAPRFLHIDGDWRDHRIFAITREEVPLGLPPRNAAQHAWTQEHTCHTSDLPTHRHACGPACEPARIVIPVDLSAIIFVVLALAWAVYLIPKALKHHDELASDRLVEGHSDKVRILARKRRTVVTETVETLEPAVEVSAPLEDAPPPSRPTRAAARKAAQRRRRVLGVLVLAFVVVWTFTWFAYLPFMTPAIPGALVVAGWSSRGSPFASSSSAVVRRGSLLRPWSSRSRCRQPRRPPR